MAMSNRPLEPQELITFKKLPANIGLENIEIPDRAENRRLTNVKWLVVLGVFIVTFLPFMIYTLSYADIAGIPVGSEKCGSICDSKWQIIISCLLSFLVAIGMLFLFRRASAYAVWGVLIIAFIGLVATAIMFWYFYASTPKLKLPLRVYSEIATVILAVSFSGLALIVGFMLFWYRADMPVVIMLLREATKAVFDMPGLISLPVTCIIAVTILTVISATTISALASSGILTLVHDGSYVYKSSPVFSFTIAFNVMIYLWLVQSFTGIQYMVIAGAVSKWYFSRDKSSVGSPILTSAKIVFRYHLGSIVLGSMIHIIGKVIWIFLVFGGAQLGNFAELKFGIDMLYNMLSMNGYVITALHGQGFIRSSIRASKLTSQDDNGVVMNSMGLFFPGMVKFFIVFISFLISVGIFATAPGKFPSESSDIWPYIITVIFSIAVACISFSIFETTAATLLICYSEDYLLNDGITKPYFVSRSMMEFLTYSKRAHTKGHIPETQT